MPDEKEDTNFEQKVLLGQSLALTFLQFLEDLGRKEPMDQIEWTMFITKLGHNQETVMALVKFTDYLAEKPKWVRFNVTQDIVPITALPADTQEKLKVINPDLTEVLVEKRKFKMGSLENPQIKSYLKARLTGELSVKLTTLDSITRAAFSSYIKKRKQYRTGIPRLREL